MKWEICVAVTILATLSHAEDPWTPSPLCPFPSENLTRFPYEGDCTKFWECYEGARYPMTCGEGLEYNEQFERCDTPAIARCNRYETITYPTFSHSFEPGSPGSTTPFTPDSLCPYPSEDVIFYPYPYNCTQYWECFEGKRYLMNCPRNLYWNVRYSYCDYLENVDCTLNSNPVTPVTPGSPTTGTPPPAFPDPLCPYPSDDLTYYPYPYNCSQYWECYDGTKYLMTCPQNLFWNDMAHVCDYKENVNCDRSTGTVPPPSNSTGTTPTTPPTPPTTTPASLCDHEEDGTYIANPTNCRQFYECSGGKAILETCPGNLLWSQPNLTCDFPNNVDCRA